MLDKLFPTGRNLRLCQFDQLVPSQGFDHVNGKTVCHAGSCIKLTDSIHSKILWAAILLAFLVEYAARVLIL